MLTYSFLNIGSDRLYEHLYKCIRKDVIHGILSPGTKLPSKRSFAKHLDISVITVENAYDKLIAEGYIYSIAKKGYYVADAPESGWWNYRPLTKDKVETEEAEQEPEGFNQCLPAPAQSHKDTYFADFLSNHTRTDNFPFSIWARLMREVLAEEKESLLLPPPSGGILQLRSAIAQHLRQFRGMHVRPEQIIIGAGTEYLYGLLIQLLGHHKVIGLENPGYKKIGQIYQSSGVRCQYISMDEHGLNLKQLMDSDVNVIHLSPSHHFPTGIVTPISRRYELLGWAAGEEGRYIIEDDYDSEFRLTGKPIPALQSIDVMERVIYMNTFTKSLASTIRISYMILPKSLLHSFYQKLGFYACTVSNFEQYTLARFIGEGYFEKHINRMRSYYREQRDRLVEQIRNSSLNTHTTICEEHAGLHFLLNTDTNYSDEEIVRRAQAAGIRLTCLSQYFQDDRIHSSEHILVINYSGIAPERIPEAVRRLAEIFR